MSDTPEKRRYSLFSKTLKSVMDPLVRPVLKAQGTAASKLISEWEHIVGKELAQHSFPVKLTFPKDKNAEGNLTIACVGAHALTLQHIQPIIMERIASYFGYKAVTRITIEQRSASPTPKPKPAAKLKTKVFDTSCVEAVEDPELKEVLSGLAKTLTGHTMPADKKPTE